MLNTQILAAYEALNDVEVATLFLLIFVIGEETSHQVV